MKLRNAIASAGFLVTSAMIAPAGATILIDDFSEFQVLVQDAASPNFMSSSVTGTGIIGGERDISILRTGVPLSSQFVIGDGSATASIANGPQSDGEFTFQWDGVDGNFANAGLLGGVDLTFDGVLNQVGIAVDLLTADLASVFTLRIGSQDGAISAATEVIPTAVSSPQTLNFLFADMLGGANFSDVSFIELVVGGDPSFDLAIAEISTIDGPPRVSEPASALLLLTGLAAIGLRRRRRK